MRIEKCTITQGQRKKSYYTGAQKLVKVGKKKDSEGESVCFLFSHSPMPLIRQSDRQIRYGTLLTSPRVANDIAIPPTPFSRLSVGLGVNVLVTLIH
jgi:hypothetical protein